MCPYSITNLCFRSENDEPFFQTIDTHVVVKLLSNYIIYPHSSNNIAMYSPTYYVPYVRKHIRSHVRYLHTLIYLSRAHRPDATMHATQTNR